MLAKDLTLCSIYHSSQPSWKIDGLRKLISIALQLTNEIM